MAIKTIPKPEPPPKEYWEDSKWASEHLTELTKQYPDMWVSVVNGQIAASSKDPKQVMEETQEKTGRKEFPLLFLEKGVRVY